MRYIERQLDHIRRAADQQSPSSTSGISTEELLQYANDGQYELQGAILALMPDFTYWDQEKTASLVGSQRAYAIDETFSLGSSLRLVEYSHDGQECNYYELCPTILKNLSHREAQRPCEYALRGTNLVLSPIPSSATGNIRVTGPRAVDRVDWRRGVVASTSSTTIVLNTGDGILDDGESLNVTALNNADYVTVVDGDGAIQLEAIDCSFDGTDTITTTVDPTSDVSAGDYVVVGKHSTTHFQFPREAESMLLSWIIWKVQHREESIASTDWENELNRHAQGIINRTYRQSLDVELWA